MSGPNPPAAAADQPTTAVSAAKVQREEKDEIVEGKLRCTKEPFIECSKHSKIKSIRFCTFSGDEIRKYAETQVWANGVYDSNDRSIIKNGMLDLRMGPPNKNHECDTCHGNFDQCPGHFGYLKLVLPVFHVGYFNLILNVLKCICKECGKILLPEKEHKEYLMKMRNPRSEILQKNAHLKRIRDMCKNRQCYHCGCKNGIVKKGKLLTIVHELRNVFDETLAGCQEALEKLNIKKQSLQNAHALDPVRVLSLFKKMSDEDCEVLNLYDRPEKLIVTHIAVPPSPVRPSSLVQSKRSHEDDLTVMLKKIIMTNSFLRESLENAAPSRWSDTWISLQAQVVEFINSESPSVSSDSKHKGLLQRLKGKQGRFRGNLSGKRVEFTGRTVISPDPNLKITEVAVPILMAMVLTYPERVSAHNIEKLRQCVRNGPSKHPGATYVVLPDGHKLSLKMANKKNVATSLKYGNVVLRHLEDGDIVLFNRQPSLHRMSIMCHRARIRPWRTLRFNESVCNPYNADFDGDEMNMHVPQTEEARTEALMLMGVQNNLCTPKNGEILVASTQDFLTSSYLITRKDTFYDRASFSLMCSYMGDGMDHIDLPTPALLKPIELWTGKQLFSVLVRPNAHTRVYLNLSLMEKIFSKPKDICPTMCYSDGFVLFRNSELICGQLGKATLGNGNKDGLFSVLLREYNSHAAASCMNRLAKLSARWIGNHGFSIGIDDVQPGLNLNKKKKIEISEGYRKCTDFISSYNEGKLTLQPGCNAVQTLEFEITGVLNQIRSTVGDVCMKELDWRNSPLIMSQCGSKGSPINISQMVACVGQQSVGGRRAPNGFIDRTLPHFPINSKTPAAKGFVANSFYSGLTATEFFFHTMGGREGLVDTAVKTADTGYMSRRLMKGLEDLSIFYDRTVRNASGGIVQFLYGDDGMDPAKMEGKNGLPLNLVLLFNKIMATCPSRGQKSLTRPEVLKTMNDRFSKDDMSHDSGCSNGFKNLLSKFIEKHADAIAKTRENLELDNDIANGDNSGAKENVAAKINGITSRQLEVFLEACIHRYHSKKVEAGAAVGAIGAQSIGEPGTQMTLKTFHFAGVASMNITQGVPRIKEIINAAKKISTPIITAALLNDKDITAARLVKGSIEKTVLGEVAKAVKSVIESGRPYISVELDMDKIKALQMGITLELVKGSIYTHLKQKSSLKRNLASVDIRIEGDILKIFPPGERWQILFALNSLKDILPKVVVKGIKDVERAVINMEKEKYNLLIEGTDLLAVMGIAGVDARETSTNHVIEVHRTLGIEAARQCIINEIHRTMKDHGMTIDRRHMMLLADLMTYKGEILGITRFGITKMKDSPIMLASFEKTSEHLFNASFSGVEDRIEGTSENVIFGRPVRLGTGSFQIIQRTEQIPEVKYAPDPIMS